MSAHRKWCAKEVAKRPVSGFVLDGFHEGAMNMAARWSILKETVVSIYCDTSKLVNLFPVASPAVVIAIAKRKKVKPNVKTIYKLWHKELWDYRFWKTHKMAARKRGLSSQIRLK